MENDNSICIPASTAHYRHNRFAATPPSPRQRSSGICMCPRSEAVVYTTASCALYVLETIESNQTWESTENEKTGKTQGEHSGNAWRTHEPHRKTTVERLVILVLEQRRPSQEGVCSREEPLQTELSPRWPSTLPPCGHGLGRWLWSCLGSRNCRSPWRWWQAWLHTRN